MFVDYLGAVVVNGVFSSIECRAVIRHTNSF